MDDGEDVRAKVESSPETCLLRSAIALVKLMVDDIQPGPLVLEALRHLAGSVRTLVVHDDSDSVVPECRGNARKHGWQGALGAVGGDHNSLLHRGLPP